MNPRVSAARAWLAALVFVALTTPLQAAERLAGTVTRVTDGDSVWLRPARGGAPVQVRLLGLDAPEICQPDGPEARAALSARLLHRRVSVAVQARDTYSRLLGRIHLQGEDIGSWLVQQGHAWSYDFRGRPAAYAREQLMARQARRGLWADPSRMEPRVFRKQHGACR